MTSESVHFFHDPEVKQLTEMVPGRRYQPVAVITKLGCHDSALVSVYRRERIPRARIPQLDWLLTVLATGHD